MSKGRSEVMMTKGMCASSTEWLFGAAGGS
jgi:hypothetical protein